MSGLPTGKTQLLRCRAARFAVGVCCLLACAGCATTPGPRAPATATAAAPEPRLTDRAPGTDFRMLTYNVNFDSIFEDVNHEQAQKFSRLIAALDPDVICLQEIRRPAGQVQQVLNRCLPPKPGRMWHVAKGHSNIIASRFALHDARDKTQPAGQRELCMALIDLPDDRHMRDVYVINAHHKCCGGQNNERKRLQQSDAIACWLRDAVTPGGFIDLQDRTPLIVAGDLNTVEGSDPVDVIVTGNIRQNAVYGEPYSPDWDHTPLGDVHPHHNLVSPDDYTWRNDNSQYEPSRLDYVLYSDSVLEVLQAFVFNTTLMTDEQLSALKLQRYDVTMDTVGAQFDHLPVVVDFRLR